MQFQTTFSIEKRGCVEGPRAIIELRQHIVVKREHTIWNQIRIFGNRLVQFVAFLIDKLNFTECYCTFRMAFQGIHLLLQFFGVGPVVVAFTQGDIF